MKAKKNPPRIGGEKMMGKMNISIMNSSVI